MTPTSPRPARHIDLIKSLCVALAGAALLAGCVAGKPASSGASTDESWPLHGGDLSNQRFSPLTTIDARNVSTLVPKWTYHSGIPTTFQTTPIVVDGVMYLSLPFSHVVALDAATGHEIWRYKHESRSKKLCCGPANRGVAVDGGKVYVGTVDGRLIALDQRTGKPLWDVVVADYVGTTEGADDLTSTDPLRKNAVFGSTGVGIGMAPLVFDGKVFVGINGVGYGLHPGLAVVGMPGQYGQTGFMAAYDARTGQKLWQWDVTAPGWEGAFRATTPDGLPMHRDLPAEHGAAPAASEAWRFGGGSIWSTPAVDPARRLLIFGTGNPSPQMADTTRPGDNLHTSSLIALNVDTGALVWHYQQVPHDRWGYDVASSPILLDWSHNERSIPAVAQASKLGWVYVHDRRDGTLLFKSVAFVPQQNLFSPPSADGIVIAPGIAGGANWSPASVDPTNNLFFVSALHLPTRYLAHTEKKPDGSLSSYVSTQPTDVKGGTLSAIDLADGHLRWQVITTEPLLGGVLSTASGLVFSGVGENHFAAFESASGKRLWDVICEAGVNAPPITYTLRGKQFVAVATGGNALFGFKLGDAVTAFGLPD